MNNAEMLKICDEEIRLYSNAPDKLNDEQQRYLEFFKSVKSLLPKEEKMTDTEIINALKEMATEYNGNFSNCVLDLINRLQAEKTAIINGQETLQKYILSLKSEVLKDFEYRLKEKLYGIPTIYNSHFGRMVNNLIKEMIEQGGAE